VSWSTPQTETERPPIRVWTRDELDRLIRKRAKKVKRKKVKAK
jgi:hypothetical protein